MKSLPFIVIAILLSMNSPVCLCEEPSDTPIRVGVLHSLSGTMALSEKSLVDAINMAVDEINQRGGVLGRQLQPIIEDGESDWPTFARKAEKLIVDDKVVSVFGCWTSASRKSVLPVFEQHKSLLWYPVQYEGRESCANIIYTGATPNQQITPAVEWCRREFGTRMFLVGSDYVFPRTANDIIKLRLADFGAKPAGEEYQPLGSMEFDEIVAKIKHSQPDVVLNTINGDSNHAFFRALAAAGIDHREIPVMSFSIAEDELRHIGVDLTVGHYCSWNYFQSIDTPANHRFVRSFRQRYGADRVTDDPIEAAYFQVHLFAKAVEKAGSTDVDAVRRAARGMIFAAPGGLIRIDPRNQHTWKVSRIGRIQSDGQFRIVWSSEDPLRPLPFLPETFLAAVGEQGDMMFTSISAMIDLEAEERADTERRKLLAAMADVRGFLGDARTKFRSAALLAQPQNRIEFAQAWNELELRWARLTERQHQLTESQREPFGQFNQAREAFQRHAEDMFEALYPVENAPGEVALVKLLPQSLRVSVVVVAALATLIAAVALGFTHYSIHNRNSQANLEQLLQLSASESAARVAKWLRERRDLVVGVANSRTLLEELRRIQQLTPEDDDYFLGLYRLKRELDQDTLSHQFIHEITIHDPETGAVILASTGENVEVPSADNDARGVAEARDHVWVSPMFAADIPLPDESQVCASGVPCLFIAAPISDGEHLYGVLRVRIRVLDIGDNLLRAASYSDMYASSDTYVVNTAGVFVSPSHFEQQLKAAGRITIRSMLELQLEAQNGSELTSAFQQSRDLLTSQPSDHTVDLRGYRGVRGRKQVGAWATVNGTDWVCIAEIAHAEAFAPLSQLARTTVLFSLLIGVFVVGLTTWLATRIVAPLKSLAAVAAQLASGDRSVRCGMQRDDEIGSLATAFDHMADSVQETLNDLERNANRVAESNQRLESELAERHRIEHELRNANAFLDSVIDNIPTMLFMKDARDLRIVRFNKAGLELVGTSLEEIIGKTDFDLYPRDEAEFFTKKDRDVLNGLQMLEIEEEELLTRNGLRILHTKKIPICDEDGKPQLLLGISEDITDRKQAVETLQAAKEAAEAANVAKSDFLANMSHEIRTPMNAIMGMTDLVLDTTLEATQREYLTIVSESAESLMAIINQILDFSKIEAGKLELETIDFDVREDVGDTLKLLGIRAHAKNLELAWQVHSNVPKWLSGDCNRLRQVLVNLIGNAIKFTGQGEVFVDVDGEPTDDERFMLHVSVRDTGVGIPKEKLDRIFSAFEQADTSTTREFGGTGLGLAITASIANAMGGRVWVESIPGAGSTFHFTGHFGTGTEPHAAEEIPDLTSLPVLVVDDNATNRRILKEMLESWGMAVSTAEGGPQAIHILQETVARQDSMPLVISDVNMPVMDGFMLTEELRATTNLHDTVVIMLTSGGRTGDLRRCQKLGISVHLMKPVKQSELLQAIIVAVGGNSARQSVSSAASDELAALPPLKILLAEDGKANQVVAVGLLTKWGHTVDVAENGELVIAMWQAGSYDVILMDVQMPVLDGLDATRRIRELERESGQRIPIVAMTARAVTGDRERCLAAGMDDYVSKPVRKAQLYRALRSLTAGLPKPSSAESPESGAGADSPRIHSAPEVGIIDWNSALGFVDGDTQLLQELLNVFIQESRQLLPQLEESISVSDPEAARRFAHTIKGGARAIAAKATAEAAAAIEASTARSDFDSARRQMPALQEAMEQLIAAVTQRISGGDLQLP